MDESRIEYLKTLKYSESTYLLTDIEFKHYFGKGPPSFGESYQNGNEIWVVKKSHKNKNDIEKAHKSVLDNNGQVFFVNIKTYHLTDEELCWRY